MDYKPQQPVAIPSLLDTGLIIKVSREDEVLNYLVYIDFIQTKENMTPDKLKKFIWKKRTPGGDFLYIAKAWQDLRRRRRFRIQCHRVRQDGSFGGRIICVDRENGSPIRR